MAKMNEDERIQQAQKKSLQMGQLKQLLKVQLRCLSMSLGLLLLAWRVADESGKAVAVFPACRAAASHS